MIVNCPHCAGEIDCTNDYSGITALCPHCGKAVIMPSRPRRCPRWLLPAIVIAAAMSIQIVGIVTSRSRADQTAPAADRRSVAAAQTVETEKQVQSDPVYERYGYSERQFKKLAYSSAKKIVCNYLGADVNKCRFPFAAANDHTKFFLFEKFKQGAGTEWHSAGERCGVNVLSYVDVKLYDVYGDSRGEARYKFHGTFHFDPETRVFSVINFSVDEQALTFEQPTVCRL